MVYTYDPGHGKEMEAGECIAIYLSFCYTQFKSSHCAFVDSNLSRLNEGL